MPNTFFFTLRNVLILQISNIPKYVATYVWVYVNIGMMASLVLTQKSSFLCHTFKRDEPPVVTPNLLFCRF